MAWRHWLTLGLLLLFPSRLAAQLPALYDDPRMLSWNQMALRADWSALAKSIEQDLQTPAPHPFAAYIWSVAESRLGLLKKFVENPADPELAKRLGPTPRLFALNDAGEYRRMLDLFPPLGAGQLRDIWALGMLGIAARDEERYADAAEYAIAALRLRGDLFQNVWELADVIGDTRVRTRVEALLKQDAGFRDSLAGRWMTIRLQRPPADDRDDQVILNAMEMWLRDRPQDASAIRKRGLTFIALGRREEGLRDLLAAVSCAPWRHHWAEAAQAQIVANQLENAQATLRQSALLSYDGSRDREAMFAERYAKVLIAADRRSDARAWLEDSTQKFPKDARLLQTRADFELTSSRPQAGLKFARAALELDPGKLSYLETVMSALNATHDDAGVFARFESEKTRPQLDTSFFWQASRAAGAASNGRAVAIWRAAVEHFPDSAYSIWQLGDALAATEPQEALKLFEGNYQRQPPPGWTRTQIMTAASAAGGLARARAEARKISALYPWMNALAAVAAPPAVPHEVARAESSAPARARLITQIGHQAGVMQAAFSPDESQVVTAGADGVTILWEAVSGKEIRRFEGHRGAVNTVAFDPTGRLIATGGADGNILVFDSGNGSVHSRIAAGVNIVTLAFSPAGDIVAAGGSSAKVGLWRVASGEHLRDLDHKSSIESVAYSGDGRLICSAGGDSKVQLWEAATGRWLETLSGHGDRITSVRCPDLNTVITASYDGTARLWDAATGFQLRSFAGDATLWSAALSTDGTRVATASRSGVVQIWDAETGAKLRTLAGHTSDVRSVAFSHDAGRLLTAGSDRTARLWDGESGRCLQVFEGRSGNMTVAAFARDGSLFAIGSDNTVHLWSTAIGREIRQLEGHKGRISAIAFSADGAQLVTGSADRTVRLWETATGKAVKVFPDQSSEVMHVELSSDGLRLLTIARDNVAVLWDVQSGKSLRQFIGLSDWQQSAAFSPVAPLAATAHDDGIVRLWDASTGNPIGKLAGHEGDVWSLAFSADGKQLLTGSVDRSSRIWDLASHQEIGKLSQTAGTVTSVALSRDGKLAVAAIAGSPRRLGSGHRAGYGNVGQRASAQRGFGGLCAEWQNHRYRQQRRRCESVASGDSRGHPELRRYAPGRRGFHRGFLLR